MSTANSAEILSPSITLCGITLEQKVYSSFKEIPSAQFNQWKKWQTAEPNIFSSILDKFLSI